MQEMNLVTEKCSYSLVTAMTLSAKRCIFSLDRSNFGFILSFKLRKCENSEYTPSDKKFEYLSFSVKYEANRRNQRRKR